MKIWGNLPIMGEAQIPMLFMSIREAMVLPLTFVLKMNRNLPLWEKLKILHENGLT
jgi:hypothetical protein